MGAIADKKLGDFLPTIDAYRPVALSVAAILGLVVVLPGAERSEMSSRFADFETTPASDGGGEQVPVTRDDEPADAAGDPAPAERATSPSAPPIRPSAPAALPPERSTSPRSSAGSGGATSGNRSASPSSPSPPPYEAPSPSPTSSEPDAEPLEIVAWGWASTTGGSPLPTRSAENIPEGTMPVGTRIAQTDKVSFLRLDGDGSELVLVEDEEGRRGSEFETSPVQLCQLVDGEWEEGENQPMSDAPEHDPDACVPGLERPDGTWAFTLFTFADPTDARGFALVPTDDAPVDFQVTFTAQAAD
jgi:hypothetical protein